MSNEVAVWHNNIYISFFAGQVFEICTSNNDFLKLLNEQISRSCPETTTEEGFTELVCAFQIVHRYIVAADAVKEKVEVIALFTFDCINNILYLMIYIVSNRISM